MGYADSFKDYASWLWKAHILPVTSNQDFFGGSVVEAIYCDCYPILPNRLAYPEHLPNQAKYFYNSFDELCAKLEKAILDSNKLESANNFVKKYNWEKIIVLYDKKLILIKKP
jgi:glycosyltransferase involved in cell wall biosynthesis